MKRVALAFVSAVWDVILAIYLVECLIIWPLLVLAFRVFESPSFLASHRAALKRWHELKSEARMDRLLAPYAFSA